MDGPSHRDQQQPDDDDEEEKKENENDDEGRLNVCRILIKISALSQSLLTSIML